MTVSDYADFNTASEHARQIAVQGVPLLHKSAGLWTLARTNLTTGQQADSGLISISSIGYEIYLTMDTPDGLAAGVNVLVSWYESAFSTTVPIAQESWWVLPGSTAVPHQMGIRGPSKGDTIRVQVVNPGNGSMFVSATALSSSRVYTRDDGRTLASTTLVAPGFTSGLYDLESNLVVNANPVNVSIGGSTSRLLPLYSGQVVVHFETASATSDMELALSLQADGDNTYTFLHLYDDRTDANGNRTAVVNLPRSQCVATLTNHNAAAKTLSVMITAAEQVA